MAVAHRTGPELRDIREAAGLTQQQVADGLNVRRETIVEWEQRARVVAPKAERYLRVVRDLASRGEAA